MVEERQVAAAFVALGANLDRPEDHIARALHEMEALPDTTLVRSSALYRSAAVGYRDQPDFINAVASGKSVQPTFEDGLRNERVLEAVEESAKSRQWIKV